MLVTSLVFAFGVGCYYVCLVINCVLSAVGCGLIVGL